MWNIFPTPKEIGCIAAFLLGIGLVCLCVYVYFSKDNDNEL